MVKLVDTPDLGSGAARCEGSSPFTRTKSSNESWSFFYGLILLKKYPPSLFFTISSILFVPSVKSALSVKWFIYILAQSRETFDFIKKATSIEVAFSFN